MTKERIEVKINEAGWSSGTERIPMWIFVHVEEGRSGLGTKIVSDEE
jgi:ribosomal protein L31E